MAEVWMMTKMLISLLGGAEYVAHMQVIAGSAWWLWWQHTLVKHCTCASLHYAFIAIAVLTYNMGTWALALAECAHLFGVLSQHPTKSSIGK